MQKITYIFIPICIAFTAGWYWIQDDMPYPSSNPWDTEREIYQELPDETSLSALKPSADEAANIKVKLQRAGFSEAATLALVETNKAYWEILQEEYPDKLDRILGRIESLAHKPAAMSVLETRPEIAGLLTEIDDIDLILASLPADETCYQHVASAYGLYFTPRDARNLADAILRHRDTLCMLLDRGFYFVLDQFVFPRNTKGNQEFDDWLNDILNPKQANTEEQLNLLVALLLEQGEDIRIRLNEDSTFRKNFRRHIWPFFVQYNHRYGADATLILLGSPFIWDIFQEAEATALLEKGGLEAVNRLYGPDALNSSIRDTAIQAILANDYFTLSMIIEYEDDIRFRNLLTRPDLDNVDRQEIIDRIATACLDTTQENPSCPKHDTWLRYADQLSQSALRDELHPSDGVETWLPLYAVYDVAKKQFQGRDVSAMDYTLAIVDIGSVLFTGHSVSSSAAAASTRGVTTNSVRTGVKNRLQQLLRRKAGASKLPDDMLSRQALTHRIMARTEFLHQFRTEIGNVLDLSKLVSLSTTHRRAIANSAQRVRDMGTKVAMRADRNLIFLAAKTFARETVERAALSNEITQEAISQTIAVSEMLWKQHIASWFWELGDNAGGKTADMTLVYGGE